METTAATAVAVEVVLTDDQISDSLSTQFGETGIVLRQSVALERIPDNDTYERVCAKVLEAAANIKKIDEHLEPHRKARRAAVDRIYEIKRRLLEPFEEVKATGSRLIAVYQHEMEAKRRTLEEAQRQEQLKVAQERQSQEAQTLFDEGREAEGVALLDAPVEAMPVVAPREVPRIKGISKARETYVAEVTDLMALVKGIAEGRVPILAVMPDQKWLNGQANAFKTLLRYDGVVSKKAIGLAGVRS